MVSLSKIKFTDYHIAEPSEPSLSSNTRFHSQQPPYIQITVLKGGIEGF